MWSDDIIDVTQRHARYRQAACRIREDSARVVALETELARLRAIMLHDWPYCVTGDTDGEAYAALLHDAGLIEWYTVGEPCDGPECCCEPCDRCQRLTDIGRAALAREEG